MKIREQLKDSKKYHIWNYEAIINDQRETNKGKLDILL